MNSLQRMARPLTVLVEGNIGAGKTQFINRFNNIPHLQILQEPVDKWRNVNGNNLLQLMYQDPCRWSLAFQTYVQLTMLENHAVSLYPIKIMERSIYSARYCFVENLKRTGKMQSSEYEVLKAWFEYLISAPEMNIDADLIVYLRTTPKVAYERLKLRSRGEEHLIPLQYIKDLHGLHEDWLLNHSFPIPAPVVVIDADKDACDLEEDFLNVKNMIIKPIYNQTLKTKCV
ncbi:deoxynucleoside kinase [Eurytemora carolleeae]|uniref:deoxynucleoside kinase n=1 Tax=Eurytemora carolleeae TaxID=1294199 RepID=UPI000C758559|nr:deoxynucleoside kinase [Eurytemora carolleeae]XP_023335100.1 deoxynucleoside kinase [Eurytemora carolleeae]|eukprot:XP_023335099.1 deoxynucleoside kinase-like [Eurytemora affinis]